MPRPEKVQAVAYIKERIEGAQAVFLAEYAGLSVKDQQTLRRELRATGAEFKVVKMSLARRAVDELEIESLDGLLLGPTGLAFADGDPVGAAKVLKDFAKGHDVFMVKGGLLGIEFLTPEKIAELADIEPREALLAKLASVMKAPMSNLAGLLVVLPRNTASVLAQLLEKKESAQEQLTADSSQPKAEEEPEADGEEPTAEGQSTAGEQPTAEDQPTADSQQPTAEEDPEASDDAETSEVEAADEPSGTEDEAVVTVEASDDAGEESENQADEASKDDAEEE